MGTDEQIPRTIFAMPVGPPYGGMTEYTAMLLRAPVFQPGRAVLFDTTPSPEDRDIPRRLLHSLGNFARLLRLVRRHRAEVVYLMSSDYLGFFEKGLMASAARMLGARVALHLVGGFIDFYGKSRWSRPAIRAVLRRMDTVITVDPRVRAYIQALAPATRVVLVPNPVDTQAFAPLARTEGRDRVQILFSGALVGRKGVMELIAAASRFRDALRGAQIVMIGDGPLHAVCAAAIVAEGVSELVALRGWVEDDEKRRLLQGSDIYCLPSHSEGTPLSVLEAMATELPVVVTSVGGLPMVVRAGSEGWLITPGDVEALGRALVSLVRSPELRRTMGARGRARVRELFDLPVVSRALESVFREMTSRGAREARGAPAGSVAGVL